MRKVQMTVFVGSPYRSPLHPTGFFGPQTIRGDVQVYLNRVMPGWHHVRLISQPVRDYGVQWYVNTHRVTVEVAYYPGDLKPLDLMKLYHPWATAHAA